MVEMDGHGHDHGAAAARRGPPPGPPGCGARPHHRLPRRAGRGGYRHRVAGPALRRRAHGDRRPRPRDGPRRHPRRQPRAPRPASARSGCTAWRSSPPWPTPSCCSAWPATCSSRRSGGFATRPDIASGVGARRRHHRPGREPPSFAPAALRRRGEPQRARAPTSRSSADTLGSIGVIVAAVVMAVTGWRGSTRSIGAAIGLFILPRAWRLGGEALRILVQAAPAGTDLGAIDADLRAIPGRRRRARPPRVDADQRDGGGHRPRHGGRRHRLPLPSSTRRGWCSPNATGSPTPRCRSSPTTTGAATRSAGEPS